MAALGWILNLGFAGGGFPVDSRETTIAGADRICTVPGLDRSTTVGAATRSFQPPARTSCVVPASNRTFTPADE